MTDFDSPGMKTQRLVRFIGSRVASLAVATAFFLTALPSVVYGQQFVYVLRDSNAIAAYNLNPLTGALTSVPGSPSAVRFGAMALAVDRSGRFVYVANGGFNVSVYAINLLNGSLAEIAGSPFATDSAPTSLAVDSAGRFVYVGQLRGISAFAVD